VMPMMAKVVAHTLDKVVRPRLEAVGPAVAQQVAAAHTQAGQQAAVSTITLHCILLLLFRCVSMHCGSYWLSRRKQLDLVRASSHTMLASR
jgi:hypothetical protein